MKIKWRIMLEMLLVQMVYPRGDPLKSKRRKEQMAYSLIKQTYSSLLSCVFSWFTYMLMGRTVVPVLTCTRHAIFWFAIILKLYYIIKHMQLNLSSSWHGSWESKLYVNALGMNGKEFKPLRWIYGVLNALCFV